MTRLLQLIPIVIVVMTLVRADSGQDIYGPGPALSRPKRYLAFPDGSSVSV